MWYALALLASVALIVAPLMGAVRGWWALAMLAAGAVALLFAGLGIQVLRASSRAPLRAAGNALSNTLWLYGAGGVVLVLTGYIGFWGVVRWWLALLILLFAVSILLHAGRQIQTAPRLRHYVAGSFSASGILGIVWAGGFGAAGAGTPAPPTSITDPRTQVAEARAYARSLDFDTSHAAWDQQWLTVKDSAGNRISGPLARILPERRSHLNYRSNLRGIGRGKGRVVARIWVQPDYRDPDGNAGYAPLHLPPGLSYVWIDSLVGDSAARALIIPDDEQYAVGDNRVTFRTHLLSQFFGNRAWARWTHDPQDEHAWDWCEKHGCCEMRGE